jgi:hypothetical protein
MMNTVNAAQITANVVELTDDIDYLLTKANEALTRPAESGWNDEDLWQTHTLMFSTPAWHLTDDYVVSEANYRALLRDFSEKYPEDVSDASFGHWTYASYNCLKVRVIDEKGFVTKAFAELVKIGREIEEEYPLYDEMMHSEVETEKFDSYLEWLLGEVHRDIERYRDENKPDTAPSGDEWDERFKDFIYRSEHDEDVSDEIVKQAVAYADSGWTYEQYEKVSDLCHRYREAFKFNDYRLQTEGVFGTPAGWLEGWVGGVTTTIYVGVAPNGDSHS